VARGYVGAPGATAERFVPDPFASEPGSRMYRTGDLVRRRADGVIEFVGRVDDQVKVRGFRVEPGEVEAGLRTHTGLRDAAVVARPDRRGEPRLVAYLAGDARPALDELRAFLRRRGLPDYMLPAAVVHMPALPRTASGKIDRGRLPEPPEPARTRPLAAPSGELELLLLGVFRDVLGHEQIGAHDHFFEVLGGNSLAVVRACALLAERAGIEVEVTALFEHPTIRALAAHLGQRGAARTAASVSHHERAKTRAVALRRRGRPG
jgi:AMP-binding enzyme/Phosphopantetheine attachment site/AMP-binding enzyme C-terminal domain